MSEKASKFRKPKNGGPMGGGPGGPGMMMPGEKAKDFKGTFKKLISYLGQYKVAVTLVIVFAIGSTIFNILGPKILGEATTKVFEGVMNMISGTGDGIDFGYVSQIMLILVILYIISALFAYIQGYIMSNVAMKVTYNLRRDISKKIHKLPLKYFDKRNYGEVLSHITNDVDAISQSLNQSLTQIITSVTSIIGIMIMMFTISWQMTLVALCVLPMSFIFIMLVVKKSQKHFVAQQESLGHVNGHIEEMYGSHTVMKAFNGEEESLKKFDVHNEKLYSSAWKSQFLSGMMMPIMSFIGNLGYVAICILGGYLAVNGRISVGDIQAFIQYMRQFTQPIAQVANISNVLQQTVAAAERVFEFLAEEEEPADSATPADPSRVKGAVRFENVHFGYDPEKPVINNFTASVQPGQKVAIVGPTGAGKSTIIKLLMRFYDIQEGSIMIDGTDIRDFARNDLRSMFGMVLQDTWLYNNTIKENIRYGKLEATDEELYAAAKAAQVDHFIRTLPDGYDMVLNEEASNVSQGQKQLLTIARAILSNPQILILDEATSSVDTRTEILIQKAMANLMKGRTSFVIAHRLSTIRDADLIFVMKDGDIIEQGTHDELLEQGGFYESLYNSQFSEGEEEAS
ncbi:ABC transporter ATP-binding protein [Paenibacillus spongiae]|uniref:ABC transporter ATP-binding protein/permease n=1 Tax=Paenibacillus spongiae TaxID=2909671 RepID=A0ABY5S3H5_9BACL|nr:ABC transporter ATP-binding protein [Paenibacillus spongiae]UVI28446.1 ABC transporter ATP-binding protein/permease [Paenibacillus spongiae]